MAEKFAQATLVTIAANVGFSPFMSKYAQRSICHKQPEPIAVVYIPILSLEQMLSANYARIQHSFIDQMVCLILKSTMYCFFLRM
ncbi:MAG: hypothetical protein OSA51_13080 [Octadecabacter sp.]|nr:hypothetical protein [Octadecabacter sp.]